MTFDPLLNKTYIGTETHLYCTVDLDDSVDSVALVNISFTRITVDGNTEPCQDELCTPVTQLSNNTFQSGIVFSPLLSGNRSNYTCSVTVQSASEYILEATAHRVYSLMPIGT